LATGSHFDYTKTVPTSINSDGLRCHSGPDGYGEFCSNF
jgi:hypothetical protein